MSAAGRVFVEALRLDRWSAAEARDRAHRALELGVGGFVLFGGRAARVRELTADLRARAGRPLWMAADLERGAGQQFAGATELPPPAGLARHPEPGAAARMAGRITGEEARWLGVNWVLAPVLDLDVEAANPIVGTRSFGGDPERVSRLGRAWIAACQAAGVAACAKHFPGHGRTRGDSHATLPVVEARRDTLQADLVPFRAVAAEVATVMAAHVAYPALGSPGPATREPRLLRGLLREDLGFRGPVATDAMIMAGFGGDGDPAPAVEALEAGCEVLLYPDDLARAVDAVERAAASPRVARQLREAVERARRVLRALPAGPAAVASLEGDLPREKNVVPEEELAREKQRSGEGALAREAALDPGPIARPAARAARAAELAEACIVSRGASPAGGLGPDRPVRLVVMSDDPPAPAGARPETGETLAAELRRAGWRVRRESWDDPTEVMSHPNEGGAHAPGGADGPTLLLLRSTPRAWKGRTVPPHALMDAARRALDPGAGGAPRGCAVVLGHERLLAALGVPGLCAWDASATMERAAARWLVRHAGKGGG